MRPRWQRRAGRASPGWVVAVVALGLGTTMWLQPERWRRTPSYHNLLNLVGVQFWGTLYLVLGVSMLGYLLGWWQHWRLAVAIHTLAIALFLVWDLAFVIRYASDKSTTIANVLAWSLYLYAAFVASLHVPPRSRQGGP